MKQAKAKTVDEAVKTAMEIEAFQLGRKKRTGKQDRLRTFKPEPPSESQNVKTSVKKTTSPAETDIQATVEKLVLQALQNHQVQPAQTPVVPTHAPLACFKCKQTDHIARDCPMKCDRCGRRSHVTRDCKAKHCTYCNRLFHDVSECFKRQFDERVNVSVSD